MTFFLTALTLLAGVESLSLADTNVTSSEAAPLSSSQRQLDVNLMYAYFQSGYYGTVILNFTRISNQTLAPDQGITEVYNITVTSNRAVIGSSAIGCDIGKGVSFGNAQALARSLGHVSFSNRLGLKEWSIFYRPLNPTLAQPISLSISLMGWIETNGNSTSANLNNNVVIQQVTLDKFQNGYLYNTLIPQEQLSQIDLLNPHIISNSPSPLPSPSPTQEPTSPQESKLPYPTTLAAITIVLVIVASSGALIYLKKFRTLHKPAS